MKCVGSNIAALIGCLLGMSQGLAHAQDMDEVYVRAGRLLDVERSRVLEDQVIHIVGERISSIGSAADTQISAGAEIINLAGFTVLPGLIDAHVHLLGGSEYQGFDRLGVSLPRAVTLGVRNAIRTLEAGFTSARVVGSPGFGDTALRDAIDAGDVIGPRLTVAGPAIGITGGHCSDNSLLPPKYKYEGEGVADGPWAVRAQVRYNIKFGVDLIKTCSTGGVMSKGTKVGAPQYTLDELEALVNEAHSHGLKVASHAHGTEGILNAIKAGVDSVEHASFIDGEGIRLAKRNGTTLVMDIYVTDYILSEGAAAGILPESIEKERAVGQMQRDNFRKAHEAGVNIVFGTDASIFPHGDNAKQFAIMVEYGMTPWEAIRSATINAAVLLGTDADVGSFDTGKYADLIAVPANPLEDVSALENVSFVMKGGVVIKGL